ncbi:MAG TPA: hypothetical protein VNJ52_04765 [Patescibacteria group bacterium]|nr:hypothetical protein [Patescibacteria group bacterium]
MAGEIPSGDGAVFAYLEMIAAAFTFAGVGALVSGKSWSTWVPALLIAAFFFVAGIKFTKIKAKFAAVDWNLWNKRISRAMLAALVVALATVVPMGIYEWRQVSIDWAEWARKSHDLFRPSETQSVPKRSGDSFGPSRPENALKQSAAPLKRRVNWHDKLNWRLNLKEGMTRTQVRRLFGEPDEVERVSTLEVWNYGTGRIDFDMEGHPDGSLIDWFEPEQ